MKDLIIVGAGGFGRDILYLAESINQKENKWNILGFIDDNLDALQNIKCNYKVIGTIKDWIPKDNEVFALGIAIPRVKEKVVSIMKNKNAIFETLISPDARINDFCEIGVGCCIHRNSTLGDNVVLKDFVHIAGSMIGQDSTIKDYSTTTGFTNIVSANIGKRVFVGSHAVVINNKIIGDDVFIGAGSIVITNIKDNKRVFGVPAKEVKY